MKPWYRKKKVWASIIGALAVVLTIFLAPERVDRFEVIAAAVLQAALAAGFVFAESSIDKADAQVRNEIHAAEDAFSKGVELGEELERKRALGGLVDDGT